ITCSNGQEPILKTRSRQGGSYWQSLGLDISAHPEIKKYKIRWYSGAWAPEWYYPGENDVDWKVSSRRVWSYFDDHEHKYYYCPDEDDDTNSCNPDLYSAPVVSAAVQNGTVLMSWGQIQNDNLTGYKVVISKDNSQPQCPDDGYLKWITDTSVTSYLVDNSTPYHSGDFGLYLEGGEDYYFSITGIYDCGGTRYSIAGNVLELTYPEDDDNSTSTLE
ncbi:hypothetical protein K8R42_04650, partial [bacterium]|nr:hypothetical protein [bacterium]